MECKALDYVLWLVETSGALNLEDTLHHRVTECLAIFNVNGTMLKTQKSKLQQNLTLTIIPEPDAYTSTFCFVDMGLIWRLTTPITEDRVHLGVIMQKSWCTLF